MGITLKCVQQQREAKIQDSDMCTGFWLITSDAAVNYGQMPCVSPHHVAFGGQGVLALGERCVNREAVWGSRQRPGF